MKADEIILEDKNVVSGTPVFANTRVPVKSLIEHLTAGDSIDVFLQSFPGVSREQVRGFLELSLPAILKEYRNARPA